MKTNPCREIAARIRSAFPEASILVFPSPLVGGNYWIVVAWPAGHSMERSDRIRPVIDALPPDLASLVWRVHQFEPGTFATATFPLRADPDTPGCVRRAILKHARRAFRILEARDFRPSLAGAPMEET